MQCLEHVMAADDSQQELVLDYRQMPVDVLGEYGGHDENIAVRRDAQRQPVHHGPHVDVGIVIEEFVGKITQAVPFRDQADQFIPLIMSFHDRRERNPFLH